MDHKTDYGITIISMSLVLPENQSNTDCLCKGVSCGSTPYTYDQFNILPQLSYAVQNNITVFFGAGNSYLGDDVPDKTPVTDSALYPACLPNVTAVGNVYDDDTLWEKSNRKNYVDFVAPGSNVVTTNKKGGFETSDNIFEKALCYLGLYSECGVSGTSISTPYLAGTVALIREVDTALNTPSKIMSEINRTAKRIYDPVSQKNYSRIDLNELFHLLDWPTFHHDNRRTGFTLLKGDMTKEADVEKIDLVLQGDVTSDSISRPSIADIDLNGNMETVITTARNENEGYVYAIETKKTMLTPFTKKLKTEVRWYKNIGRNILVTPTVANIDSDPTKEVIFGLDNGTLFALDISSSGDSASVKWTYTVSEKSGYTGELGNTAVVDIDNDGTNEIIVMDGKTGLPSWSGEVYVLRDNGDSATLEDSYTISNGGGFGAVSLANVDDDDNLEIIVPSYYGVYVLDYDGSALTEKCNTDHGKLSNSVVVYDVDRDNKYELIYTTSTYGCTAPKTCYNKLYIIDPETCNDESGWPKTLSYYSRTTPAIANLDSDSNLEIVISARDSTSATDYSSRILCYDANTGAEHCNYNNGGSLEAYEISPDIFDVDGDGNYNIILPDKNYELHILDNDGTKKYSVTLSGIIGSAPAVGDLDNDGKAEVAVKRAGSPINVLTTMSEFNQEPILTQIYNIPAIAGSLININESGLLSAEDPDGDSLIFYYSSPFNESGLWQSTINDTGNYSILIEASDGNLSDYQYVDLMVFSPETNVTNTFADGTTKKSLSFTGGENQTVYVRLPKNSTVIYSKIKIEGLAP